METFSSAENSAEALHRVLFTGPRKLSVRQISKKLGFASDRSLGMVLKGQRVPTPEMINRVARKYRLSSNGLLLINLLAQRDRLRQQARPTTDLDEEIRKIRPISVAYQTLAPRQLQALQSWMCFPTIEILRHQQAPLTPAQVLPHLLGNVGLSELTQNLRAMATMGLIQMDDEGRFSSSPDEGYFFTSTDLPSKGIRQIHRNQLSRAADCLEEQSVFDREFQTKTLTIPADRMAEAKDMLSAALEELSRKLSTLTVKDESVVIQLGAQMFQQSRPMTPPTSSKSPPPSPATAESK